jgi:D-alanyl-D-alanine carboxypeptidase
VWTTFPGVLLPSPGAVVQRVMDDHGVPAMSVAIAKAGKIVFAQGFGYADGARREKVTADSLFRIASNSKAITSAAIHLLVERGQLSLSDRVFGDTGILGNTYGTRPYTNWLVQIDVRQLLEHSAGGWQNDGNDPMFKSPHLDHTALIGATLDADLLKRPPGVEFMYSNFGYCLLGRVIERKSGQRYEDFVRRSVLIPAGVNGMRIGQDTLAGRAPGEVVYVSNGGGSPYDLPVRRMDSHGGWISSAADYVRFLLAIDNSAAPPDVISAASVKSMRTRGMAAGTGNYGKGVGTNAIDIWHNGMLLGSRSVMWGGTGGDAWCVICTGGPAPGSKGKKKGDPLLTALDKMMWRLWDLV